MAEELIIDQKASKEELYQSLIPQIKALCEGEEDLVANLSNTAAALMQTFRHLWIGFYINKQEELVLGPFQGPIACTRIAKGKGVCGTSLEKMETIIVEDVDQFPGHIACSSDSKSEIVTPIFSPNKDKKEVAAIIDIDSRVIGTFDETDQKYLEEVAMFLSQYF